MKLLRYTILSLTVLSTLFATDVAAQAVDEVDDGLFATRELSLDVTFGRGDRLVIQSVESLRGSIRVVADDVNEIRADYIKQARAANRSLAIDYIDRIGVVAAQTPTGAEISLRAPNPPPWESDGNAGMVQIEVVVPEGSSLEINAQLFDVEVVGPLSNVSIVESLGRIQVTGVTSRLDVATANRRVTIEDVAGDVFVSTSNSLLEVSNVRCESGQRADFRNDEGDIRIESFNGEITVRNSYGRIDMTDITLSGRRNLVRSAYGPIFLELVKASDAQLKLSNRHEDIEVEMPEDISAVLSLAVEEDSRIEVSSFSMRPELVERDRLSMIVGGSESLISGSISGKGNIFVRGYTRED